MSEIKPVYQVRAKGGSWVNCLPDDVEAIESLASNHWLEVMVLYPAAAYEALQKENAELIKDRQHYANRADLSEKSVRVLQAENAAQAKRISKLEQKDEMLDDMCELLKINKENWFSLYSVVAELK